MNLAQQIRNKQERLKRLEQRREQRLALTLVLRDLVNLQKRFDALEYTATRCGYPGQAGLIGILLDRWIGHIRETHHMHRVRVSG